MAWKPRADGCIIRLEDMTGQLPASIKTATLGEEKYKQCQSLGTGDVVGLEGRIFRTKRGELSLLVTDFILLSKALRCFTR